MMRRMNDIDYATDAWLGELARRGRSEATRFKYQWLLWKFSDHVGGKPVDEISVHDCRRFLDQWIDHAPSTIALHVSTLRGFFDFLDAEGALTENPMTRIKRPPRKRAEDVAVVSVTGQDVERVVQACATWQELLCIAVLCYLGPRRAGASRVRRRDVDNPLRWL